MNDFVISMLILGALSTSGGSLPFWMTANQYGLMPENDGALALVQASTQFDDSKTWQWRWGASLAANTYYNPLVADAGNASLMVDELYGSLKWKVFTLDVGSKHRAQDFLASDALLGSLSTTGGHMAETGNARAIPGYLVTLDPVAVPWTAHKLWIYGSYGDGITLDDRYVDGALLHRMNAGVRLDVTDKLSFSAGLDHFALWGGESPELGRLPVTLGNYVRVAAGQAAGASGPQIDRANVIGDHRGCELLKLDYSGSGWKFTAQHEIPYDDRSGMGFQNFPDGVNTLCFSWDDKNRWVSDILYEYQYTMFQSGPIYDETYDEHGNPTTPEGGITTGNDNYFNNYEFCSGWTYHGRTIGNPLFYPAGTRSGLWTSAVQSSGVENNRLKAHHFGLSGRLFKKYPYKLMLTYSRNYGTYLQPYAGKSQYGYEWGTVEETALRQFSAAFVGSVDELFGVAGFSALYGLYADYGDVLAKSAGATLGLRYSF